MQYKISDPKIFEILTRNRIHFWPDVRCHGTDLNLASGQTTMLGDGSILENQGSRRLVLIREGTPPQPGLIRLTREHLCETGWGSVIENDHCGNLTRWQFDGWKLCTHCMRQMSNMNSDNKEAFAEALEEEYRQDSLRSFFLAAGAYVATCHADELHKGAFADLDTYLQLMDVGRQWDMRSYV